MSPSAPLPVAFAPPHGPAADALAATVTAGLPGALVDLWASLGRGWLLVSPEFSPQLERDALYWRDVHADGALLLPPDCAPQALWEMVGEWLDLLGGSLGRGERLSEGHGATPALAGAAHRFADLCALGYSETLLETREPALLLARAVALHQLQPAILRAADPPLGRWMRGTLFDEGFWRRVAREVAALPG